jgi:hypothetical protein
MCLAQLKSRLSAHYAFVLSILQSKCFRTVDRDTKEQQHVRMLVETELLSELSCIAHKRKNVERVSPRAKDGDATLSGWRDGGRRNWVSLRKRA